MDDSHAAREEEQRTAAATLGQGETETQESDADRQRRRDEEEMEAAAEILRHEMSQAETEEWLAKGGPEVRCCPLIPP